MSKLYFASTAPTNVRQQAKLGGGFFTVEEGVKSELFYHDSEELSSIQERAEELLGEPAVKIVVGHYESTNGGMCYFSQDERIL